MGLSRKRIGLLFGGRSAEHDVSRLSAANVLRALAPERYEVIPIGIDRDGRWLLCRDGAWIGAPALDIPPGAPRIALVPGGGGEAVILDAHAAAGDSPLRLDVVFPVLHGPNGEDGTVQGLLELAGVAYVGSGVAGSAVSMDKDLAKRLLRDAGIPVVPFLAMTGRDRQAYGAVAAALGSPDLFVKPARLGSSVGISRARSAAEYEAACDRALRHDDKILVERSVAGLREIECAILEDAAGEVRASPVGEIVPAVRHGFYTYEAKYLDPDGANLRAPADLAPARAEAVRALAVAAFRALDCEGMARVDFFVDAAREGAQFVNEVNTLPGFTAISMYPKLWEAAGVAQAEVMDVLVAHAEARHARRRALALA
jgi:D-alanine-D-alanine ligase